MKVGDVPAVTQALLKAQGWCCPLCGGSLRAKSVKRPALDHDHNSGYLRDVLCINCNGIEGKVYNLARRAKNDLTPEQWVENLLAYWKRHQTVQHGGVFHHTHKTEEEKRLARNRKARLRRAKLKKG
tara:strand:+ start:9734 stop:10114 length:381 start_codon:yes stop_codon:yes gene_type:complete